MTNNRDRNKAKGHKRHERLSLYPLPLEDVLRGVMEVPPPGPKRKREGEKGEKKPPAKRGRKPRSG